MSGLLSTSSTQVLLNGTPGDFIAHRRGLRQGDPLSPMLFILVMDTLNLLVMKASGVGLLQPLCSRSIQHRLSLYADDVVLFLRPTATELELTVQLLQIFGEASGLKTNIQKSSMSPIRCTQEDIDTMQSTLTCQLSEFPIRYLGLPLSLKKLTWAQIQPFIDRLADLLLSWRSDLMTKQGRVIQVQHMMTTTVLYFAMALDFPRWAIKAWDKIRRGYVWRGRKDAKGGHCLVAWPKVTRPKELGGLGISDLHRLTIALRVRWSWLKRTTPHKAWAFVPIQTNECTQALLSTAMITEVGDGGNTLFWKDRWILGKCIGDLFPLIRSMVPQRAVNRRNVSEAFTSMSWIRDLHGEVTLELIAEFLNLCLIITQVTLQPGVEDKHVWKFSTSGNYSTKSAYEALFLGLTGFEPWERIWKTWAPGK